MPASAPVPIMYGDVWDEIKSLDITDDGGWEIDETEHWLAVVRDDTKGKVQWVLVTWDDTPSGRLPRGLMSSSDWSLIKNGTLSTQNNTITASSTEYRVAYTTGTDPDHPIISVVETV